MNTKYNDYELLYLIRENDDVALEILLKKYHPLIYGKIKEFNIKEKYFDDFFQEGLICLYKAIISYDMNMRKSFNKYVSIVIKNKYINLITNEYKHFYNLSYIDNFDMVSEDRTYENNISEIYDEIESKLTPFEKEIYKMLYQYKLKPKNIVDIFGYNRKKVYNATFKIKEKVKDIKK